MTVIRPNTEASVALTFSGLKLDDEVAHPTPETAMTNRAIFFIYKHDQSELMKKQIFISLGPDLNVQYIRCLPA